MASGSQKTYGGWEPRICHGCHQKIVLTKDPGSMFYFDHVCGVGYSFHAHCMDLSSVTRHAASS